MRLTSLFIAIALLLVVTLSSCNGDSDNGKSCAPIDQYERCYIIRIIDLLNKAEIDLKALQNNRKTRFVKAVTTITRASQCIRLITDACNQSQNWPMHVGPISGYQKELDAWKKRSSEIYQAVRKTLRWHNRFATTAQTVSFGKFQFGGNILDTAINNAVTKAMHEEHKMIELYTLTGDITRNEQMVSQAISDLPQEHATNKIAVHVRGKLTICASRLLTES